MSLLSKLLEITPFFKIIWCLFFRYVLKLRKIKFDIN